MIFNSLTYVIFLLTVVVIYWNSRQSSRLAIIFAASIIFYGFWRVDFITLLLFSTCVDFFLAKRIETSQGMRRKIFLYISLVTNLGLLIFFKYLYFLHDNIAGVASFFGLDVPNIPFNIILPLGISFYTFQTISYTVDVYRGHLRAEDNFLAYGCYVLFFPQLIAGPVLRAGEIIPQLKAEGHIDWYDLREGCKRIVYGLFLKVVIADNIAPFVDEGFLVPSNMMSAWDVWTLSFLFGFQIYFDFSAYSHIALGTARLLGIKFPENFNFPYAATDPRDFWKRWHISLSSWIRDYLYLPLVGSKVIPRSEGGLGSQISASNQFKENRGLFYSWGVMGLWHGANWTFLLWGLYHATIIYAYRKIKKYSRISINPRLAIFITLPIMMLGWIPFRAVSVEQSLSMWLHVITPTSYFSSLSMKENVYLVALLMLIGFFTTQKFREFLLPQNVVNFGLVTRIAGILGLTVLCVLVVIFLRPVNQFIYFQF